MSRARQLARWAVGYARYIRSVERSYLVRQPSSSTTRRQRDVTLRHAFELGIDAGRGGYVVPKRPRSRPLHSV